jgi:hypothetical protein
MIEQRKHQRFDLRMPMEILGGKSQRPKGETRNVSSCGVLFAAPGPVQVGEPIEYVITLPKAPGARLDVHLRCVGKVVRSHQPAAFAATLERYEFVRGKL